MSLAAETRRAADDHPFLVDALRTGVVNYTAAARFLSIDGETEAVATALRRYAEDLPAYESHPLDVRVTMVSGVGTLEAEQPLEDALLVVGGTALGETGGAQTAIVATGEVDAGSLREVLGTLAVDSLSVQAAGVGSDTLVVVVDRLDGASAVRAVERALE